MILKLPKVIRIVAVNLFVLTCLVFLLDLIAYAALPKNTFPDFREYRRVGWTNRPSVAGRGLYPKDYYVADSVSGFDIGVNRRNTHWVEGMEYPIWSNSLGCFDTEHESSDGYVYLAGDSQTWGYTPFESKFGVLLESAIAQPVLKCGVSHTGQLQQLEKMQRVVSRIGHAPERIFVFYSENDPANDFAYPHTTVIDGWMINNVMLNRDNEITHISSQELEQIISANLRELQSQEDEQSIEGSRLNTFLRHYSLSFNLFRHSLRIAKEKLAADTNNQAEGSSSRYRSFYWLPVEKDGRFWYEDNEIAHANKDALIGFMRLANEMGSELTVVLIQPPPPFPFDAMWYSELHEFLGANDIRFIDLAEEFIESGLKRKDLIWEGDGHFNPEGNKAVAEVLVREFGDEVRQ